MNTRVRNWVIVWAGWTALALFLAVSASLTYRSTGRAANWTLSIERSLSEWWLWALLTPVIVWLAARFPLDRPRPWRNAVIHIGAALVIGIAKTVAERAIFAWLTGFWMYLLVSTLALQCVVYGAVVAAVHGLRYQRRSRERDQLEKRLADARLQLLGMQLQPHFLFNTLNTIAELVHDDADAADCMITGLSDLLRRTLELGVAQQIPLDAELELLARYVNIQKARFGARLQLNLAIDPLARGASVPVLLFQPLVENAIRHGLAERVAAGRIEIAARRIDDRLVITVTDDGVGRVETNGAGGDSSGRVGIGLANIRARLEALYGADHQLALANAPERGVQVSVDIPFRTEARAS
jgi:two-component system, LytTR family, sensor kinase